MEYTTLGPSGLRVSRIALGCMGFSNPGRGVNPWTLDDTTAAPIFRRAIDLGITLWDTANVYGNGIAEEIVGRAHPALHAPGERRARDEGPPPDAPGSQRVRTVP